MHLSDTIQRLSESATLAMARKSRELKEKGVDVISLSLGEPDFDTPDFIKKAAIEAIHGDYSSYPPVNGYAEVREAISKKFKRDNGLDYSPSQIVVSNGAKQSIANIALAMVSTGEEVILPAPFWVSYEEIVKLANGIPKIIKTGIETDFKITAQQLDEAITPNTRMMIFSSPCNPTGSVYSKEELYEMAKVIQKYPNFYVVSDEIYEHINFAGKHESLAQFDSIYDRVITVNGVSKSFAMTGWRIGYIGAADWIAKACTKIQGQVTSGACGIAEKAAECAVLADPSVTKDMVVQFRKRRDFMIEELSKIDGLQINHPEGAFYIYPEVSSFLGRSYQGQQINTTSELTEFLLEEVHVAFVAGEAFGTPGYIRISYAASMDELREAVSRLKKGLGLLS
ncbi:MAG: pyridoxal phosphate-dependent aminotransferase [Flavobacteriales bacterium]|nr:pyridoxal phosphate-dependent aminotransferase [Flavobacteriales bacterium]NNK80504.1 pyridoxal phosphate-dependent aminotransferase [Flavobacteriales bacterium]